MFENKSLKSDVARLLDSLAIYKGRYRKTLKLKSGPQILLRDIELYLISNFTEMPSIEEHMRRVLTNLQNASELSENLVKQSQKDTSRECTQTKKRSLDDSENKMKPKRHMSEVVIKEEYDPELSMENSNDYDSTEYLDHNYWNSFGAVAENSVNFARMNNNTNEALLFFFH